MSHSNLSVAVTADETQLRAKLALAQADLRAYAAAVRQAASDIRSSGAAATAEQTVALDKASAAYNTARAAVQSLSAQMRTTATTTQEVKVATEAATEASHNHGAATEALVVVHELLSGNLSRVGGSMMILTQRLAGANVAMMLFAGAIGVGVMQLIHLVEWLHKVEEAKVLAEAGGLGSGISNATLDAQVMKLRGIGDTTTEAAGKAVSAFARLRGVSAPVLDELTSDVHGLALRMGEDVPAAATRIADAWDLDLRAGTSLLESTRASSEAVDAFTKAAQNHDAIRARTVLLQELARSQHEVDTQTRASADAEGEARTARMRALSQLALPSGPLRAARPEQVQQAEEESAQVRADRLSRAIASIGEATKAAAPQSLEDQWRTTLDRLTLETERSARQQGTTWQKTHEAMAQTAVDFWTRTLATTRAGTKEHDAAERSLYQAQQTLEAARIQNTERGAKEALQIRLAELSAEQAANRTNFAEVMRIEDQKLALLRAGGAEYSRQYQEELRRREDMLRQHEAQQRAQSLEHITKQMEIDREATAERRALLDQEVADGQITRQQELAELMRFSDQQYRTELDALNNLVSTLDQGTAEYQKALDQRTLLEQRHAREVAALNAQIASAERADNQRALTEYERTFQGIGSAGRNAFMGLVGYTTTWQQAEAQVARAVLSSAFDLTARLLTRWAAYELAKTLYTDRGVVQRVMVEQAQGGSGWSALLARWIGLETAKTTATRVGAVSRTAADSGGGILSAIASILARWLGLEGAKTAATTAGAGERAIAESAASLSAQAPAAAAAVAEIERQAAVAAAGAFAATAAIPVVGPELAPAAAKAAYAEVMLLAPLASFAVGAWQLPGDMVAQVHSGEMIVPSFQAGMIRSGQATLGADGISGGAGGGIHIHGPLVSAIDTQTGAAFLMQHMPVIVRGVAMQMSRNPSTRAQY